MTLPPPPAPPAPQPPAGWYADPAGRYQYRWWDGARWTDNVANGGQSMSEALGQPYGPPVLPGSGPTTVTGVSNATDVQRQVQRLGAGTAAGGGGSIFTEPVLVVNQKAKLIELTNEYAVFDQRGNQIGSVVEIGQTAAKKVLRFVSNLDQFMTHRLEVRDTAGTPLLQLVRPAKIMKSSFQVLTPQGAEIGRITQENVFGKKRFALSSGNQTVGQLRAENWRAWNIAIVDAAEREVGRITKTFDLGGVAKVAKEFFTTADNYVVQFHQPLQDPLRSLAIVSALTIDTALKQDDRNSLF